MYAIVNIQGKQLRVAPDEKHYVPLMPTPSGEEITLDQVLLLHNGKQVAVGKPCIDGARVLAEVVTQEVKGPKVTVFKKKRRKGYAVKQGHRERLSLIRIKEIVTQ